MAHVGHSVAFWGFFLSFWYKLCFVGDVILEKKKGKYLILLLNKNDVFSLPASGDKWYVVLSKVNVLTAW